MKKKDIQQVLQNWELYLFLLPAVLIIFCFNYIPMYGVQIAFKNFSPARGIWGSPWVGLYQFQRFFRTYQAKTIISNTLILSLYTIVVGFPFPVFLALLINSLDSKKYKRVLQTITYMPHFISTVVLVGMLMVFVSPVGIQGFIARVMGGTPSDLMGKPQLFRHWPASSP
jgi:putative aldouronate transport system permease protein